MPIFEPLNQPSFEPLSQFPKKLRISYNEAENHFTLSVKKGYSIKKTGGGRTP